MKKILVLVLLFVVGACTEIKVAGANFPSLFSNQEITYDIKFGKEKWQKLDVYTPPELSVSEKKPVVIFLYGGRWTRGTKSNYRFVGDALTERGYVVVVPDYRKYPEVKFPAFVYDGAKAVAWVHENIKEFGGDKDKIFLLGHSAGAHMAALIATDNNYLLRENLDKKIIKGVIGLAGPYVFTPHEKDLKDIFGPPERYKLMQVDNYIDGTQPPMFLLWGRDDNLVKFKPTKMLASAIKRRGGSVVVKKYDDIDHVNIIGVFSKVRDHLAPIVNDVDEWIKKIMQHNQ